MSVFRFLIALAASGIVVSIGSIGWPKFTSQPRPRVLESVHTVVKDTQVGQALSEFLGIKPGEVVEPVNVASVAGSVVGAISSSVQKKATEAVTGRLVSELVGQYETLPEDQKEQMQTAICHPKQ